MSHSYEPVHWLVENSAIAPDVLLNESVNYSERLHLKIFNEADDMYATIEDFDTGWFGLYLGIKHEEIDLLINLLSELKHNTDQHFHFRSDFTGEGGVGDIEIRLYVGDEDNMSIDGLAIEPSR